VFRGIAAAHTVVVMRAPERPRPPEPIVALRLVRRMTAAERPALERGSQPWVARVMAFEAAALAIIATLHLTGTLGGGAKRFDPKSAEIVEAIIGVLLAYGAGTLMRDAPRHRLARGTVSVAIVGFIVGLVFTVQGGDTIDLAFHATMLPLLPLTLLVLRLEPTLTGEPR
jgi:hypothetical protein